uniref:Transposase n=1 Tax=viral metagenome TaxID=1070528 RepID=A0A6M3M1C9_9ZZZZ
MLNKLVDCLIVTIVTVAWWWDSIFNRCSKSPNGHHFTVVKDAKYQCKYCGRLEERQEPGE